MQKFRLQTQIDDFGSCVTAWYPPYPYLFNSEPGGAITDQLDQLVVRCTSESVNGPVVENDSSADVSLAHPILDDIA